MYFIAISAFILGIVSGGVYGYFFCIGIKAVLMSLIIGGFTGSCIGTVLFTIIFFGSEQIEPHDKHYQKNKDQKKEITEGAILINQFIDTSINNKVGANTIDNKVETNEIKKKKIAQLEKEIKMLKKYNNK